MKKRDDKEKEMNDAIKRLETAMVQMAATHKQEMTELRQALKE